MQLHIRHETRYEYEEPVSYSIQALKLTPRADPGQRIVSWRVLVPGGVISIIDCAHTPFGRFFFSAIHPEPYDSRTRGSMKA